MSYVGKEGSFYRLMAVGRDSEGQAEMIPIHSSPCCWSETGQGSVNQRQPYLRSNEVRVFHLRTIDI